MSKLVEQEPSKKWSLVDVAKMHGNGRIVVPQDVRENLDVKDGDKIAFYRNFKGVHFIVKVEESKIGPRYGSRRK